MLRQRASFGVVETSKRRRALRPLLEAVYGIAWRSQQMT
jgi:hypothetical protein